MLGRQYFTRQAATLLKFASETRNQQLAAVLVARAAELKAKSEEETPHRGDDMSLAAPDVEQ